MLRSLDVVLSCCYKCRKEYIPPIILVTANRIDSKALQENRPDIYNVFVKASTYERLTVK
ncbi:MAG: hypothetical protein PUI48_07255 [Oscillospiraceae bacterium]|nr:hypothetical protein [Oscillospiraceae bacterium]MDY6208007.1 hypothetical protein [Oscillospiraceae bacterium]